MVHSSPKNLKSGVRQSQVCYLQPIWVPLKVWTIRAETFLCNSNIAVFLIFQFYHNMQSLQNQIFNKMPLLAFSFQVIFHDVLFSAHFTGSGSDHLFDICHIGFQMKFLLEDQFFLQFITSLSKPYIIIRHVNCLDLT